MPPLRRSPTPSLLDSREEAARDRAQQAQAYARLTEARVTENVEFAADMTGKARQARRHRHPAGEAPRRRRRGAWPTPAASLGEARDLASTTQRENEGLNRRLVDAEERASQAVVRVAELEAELDVVTSEPAHRADGGGELAQGQDRLSRGARAAH
ncbi:hypothetical protein [Nocardioides convexus]|uniref:hypothetical protein n=1 Tax=Nocardioides convexus TaxID=2712224 RepID=UPI00241875ED|nr:hypothetical protein [Nocardioides convexus]